MESAAGVELVTCPACGGAGGGPFGPAGSAWDDEAYVCARCKGRGVVPKSELDVKPLSRPSERPGIVKAPPSPPARQAPAKKKKRA